jgi:hypothetical protein
MVQKYKTQLVRKRHYEGPAATRAIPRNPAKMRENLRANAAARFDPNDEVRYARHRARAERL